MREIEFRGLDYKNIWHYGYFWIAPDGTHFIKEAIVRTHSADFAVIPETVGQYTNFKDNSTPPKKIYERDIIKADGENKTVVFSKDVGCFEAITDIGARSLYGYIKDSEVKIIGNIYENSE